MWTDITDVLKAVYSEDFILSASSNSTILSGYSMSEIESPDRSVLEKSDDESVISGSMSMMKLDKNGESGQPW